MTVSIVQHWQYQKYTNDSIKSTTLIVLKVQQWHYQKYNTDSIKSTTLTVPKVQCWQHQTPVASSVLHSDLDTRTLLQHTVQRRRKSPNMNLSFAIGAKHFMRNIYFNQFYNRFFGEAIFVITAYS